MHLSDLASLAVQRYRTTPALIAEVLREAILRGILEGGMQLRQDEIAKSFGVSRIPVREALRQLAGEGLVEFKPHRGAIVSTLSTEEIREIYEIRIALETMAIQLAVPQLTEEDLARAEQILEEIDRETDTGRWSELNGEFHATLYAPAKRPHLFSLINTHRTNVDRYLRIYISVMKRKQRSQAEHRRILEACRRRDTEGAVKALEEHLRSASEQLVTYLEKGQERAVKS
ncbi:MAG: GntR family transcriptional regulator [Armatimonadota bacterium]|nr:GntR family transcriptional regulator [Armatimonadota bacterium]MDR5703409.1 GntR family transcriptional regulator [Armatimonadota bacterium]MDR7434847.1 GntR family transcriptional regulator [Armatimonadota bacterium]